MRFRTTVLALLGFLFVSSGFTASIWSVGGHWDLTACGLSLSCYPTPNLAFQGIGIYLYDKSQDEKSIFNSLGVRIGYRFFPEEFIRPVVGVGVGRNFREEECYRDNPSPSSKWERWGAYLFTGVSVSPFGWLFEDVRATAQEKPLNKSGWTKALSGIALELETSLSYIDDGVGKGGLPYGGVGLSYNW